MGFISNKKRLYRVLTAVLVFLSISFSVCGQALRGTTGLLHAPTADMQQDKTFMLGGNVLDITPLHYYDFDVRYTFNYYLNITVFPWLEVGYTCTCLERGMVENVDSADRDRGGRSGYS